MSACHLNTFGDDVCPFNGSVGVLHLEAPKETTPLWFLSDGFQHCAGLSLLLETLNSMRVGGT